MEHLDQLQRYQISAYLKIGKSYGYIAKALEVSKSTISREIGRNGTKSDYNPHKAQQLADKRLREDHVYRKYRDETWEKVNAMLRMDFSPEQVSGRLKLEGAPAPSAEAIYQHVWRAKSFGSDLYTHLRRKNHKYHKRGNVYERRGRIANRRDISERPAAADARSRFGDLEIDTVIGKGALLTMNDRATGFSFARPYCSNDRASNENMNGLIRQYVPKGTSMETLTDEDVRNIQHKLNSRPRKRFDYKTPEEYLLGKFNLSLR